MKKAIKTLALTSVLASSILYANASLADGLTITPVLFGINKIEYSCTDLANYHETDGSVESHSANKIYSFADLAGGYYTGAAGKVECRFDVIDYGNSRVVQLGSMTFIINPDMKTAKALSTSFNTQNYDIRAVAKPSSNNATSIEVMTVAK